MVVVVEMAVLEELVETGGMVALVEAAVVGTIQRSLRLLRCPRRMHLPR